MVDWESNRDQRDQSRNGPGQDRAATDSAGGGICEPQEGLFAVLTNQLILLRNKGWHSNCPPHPRNKCRDRKGLRDLTDRGLLHLGRTGRPAAALRRRRRLIESCIVLRDRLLCFFEP